MHKKECATNNAIRTNIFNQTIKNLTNLVRNIRRLYANKSNIEKDYSNVKHYIVSCNAIGEYSGESSYPYKIETGKLSDLCFKIK